MSLHVGLNRFLGRIGKKVFQEDLFVLVFDRNENIPCIVLGLEKIQTVLQIVFVVWVKCGLLLRETVLSPFHEYEMLGQWKSV